MNSVDLIGRLTKDAELKQTQSGNSRATFTLAVDGFSKNDDADFIRCTAWSKAADILTRYTHKGSQIGVSGRIHTYSYEDQQGTRVYVTEVNVNSIKLLDPKQQNNDGYQSRNNHGNYQNDAYQPGSKQHQEDDINVPDEDLPF